MGPTSLAGIARCTRPDSRGWRWPGTLPHDQRGLRPWNRTGIRLRVQDGKERGETRPAQRREILANCGKGRRVIGRKRSVVETYNAHVARNAAPRFVHGTDDPEGKVVVPAQNRRHVWITSQLAARFIARLRPPSAWQWLGYGNARLQ